MRESFHHFGSYYWPFCLVVEEFLEESQEMQGLSQEAMATFICSKAEKIGARNRMGRSIRPSNASCMYVLGKSERTRHASLYFILAAMQAGQRHKFSFAPTTFFFSSTTV